MSAIAHPLMLGNLGRGFFRYRCTIQRKKETQDSYGQPVHTWESTVIRNVQCALEAEPQGPQFGEMRGPEREVRFRYQRITLTRQYQENEIDPSTDRAVVTDTKGNKTPFNIVETISDSQGVMTTLLVLRTKPGSEE